MSRFASAWSMSPSLSTPSKGGSSVGAPRAKHAGFALVALKQASRRPRPKRIRRLWLLHLIATALRRLEVDFREVDKLCFGRFLF